MGNIKDIITSFNETLAKSKLTDVAEEMIETIIDNNISDGLVKDIPIINTLLGIVQSTYNISNYLLLRKITAFIFKIKDISPEKRNKIIKDIDKSGKYKEKIGITLLSIIDKCESVEKAEYIAILFRSFLKEDIGYECFMYGAHIIQRSYLEDFKTFIFDGTTWKMTEDATDEISLGLYYLDITLNLKAYRKGILSGVSESELGEVGAYITQMGVTLRSIFLDAYEEGVYKI